MFYEHFTYEDAKTNTELGNRSRNQKLSCPFLAMTCLLSNCSKFSVLQFSWQLSVTTNNLVTSFMTVIAVVTTFKSENEEAAVVAEETAGVDIGEEKLIQFCTERSLFTSKCNPS